MSTQFVLVLCLVLLACTEFSAAQCTYTITTVTGTRIHAQTPYDVMLRLKEGNVKSPWITLRNTNGQLFRPGSTNEFCIEAVCLNSPCIKLKMKNGNDKWYANTVDVHVPDAQNGFITNIFTFTINRMISSTKTYSRCESVKYPYFSWGKQCKVAV